MIEHIQTVIILITEINKNTHWKQIADYCTFRMVCN